MTLDERMKELYKDITKQFEECQKATDELYEENETLKKNRDSAINYIDQVIMYEISNFDYKKVYDELDELIGILKR